MTSAMGENNPEKKGVGLLEGRIWTFGLPWKSCEFARRRICFLLCQVIRFLKWI